jgi:DNA mismatch repair protein MSH2
LTLLSPSQDYSASLAPYQELVETTIDLSELDRHNYVIKPEFDDVLKELMEKLAEVRDGLDEEHKNVARALNMDPEGKVLHFEQHATYGYCFRLTRKVRRVLLSLSRPFLLFFPALTESDARPLHRHRKRR